MDFYIQKTQLIQEIERIVSNHKGKEISLSALTFETIKKYGFGERMLKSILKHFVSLNQITIEGDTIYILKYKKGRKKI